MKEIRDRELFEHYLDAFQIKSIFNEQITLHLSLYSYEQGETICNQGQPSEYLFLLVKGKIKIYTTSTEGKTLILSFKRPLDLVGDIEYVRGTDIQNTVEAVSPVYMIGVHYQWLRKYGRDHAPLLKFLLDIITRKFYIKSNSMSYNLLYPVKVRLASYLLSISFDESDVLFTGELSAISLKDVANLIGTSYRHLNRVIHQFCEDGLIERSRGYIKVKDRQGLSVMASDNIYE